MSRSPHWIGLLALAVALPALAADDKQDAKKDDAKGTSPPAKSSIFAPPEKSDKHKYVVVNAVTGKIGKVDAKAQELTIEVRAGVGRYAKNVSQDLTLAEDVVVRTANPPERLDENGKPKKIPPDELRKLKGNDPKVPGYAAEPSALQKGQTVKVTLSRLKDTKKAQTKDKAEKEQLYVTMVEILSEDRPARPSPKK
jgi:hypothetical protein